jgi:RNA polymerase sigma factor (sigma-70 family)
MAERNENSDFGRVVLPHLADAMTIATWLTGNRADAEDVVQEACLRALKAMSTYAGGSPRAWTLTIVRNCAFAWLRKNRSNDLVSFDHLAAEDLAIAESGGDLKTSFASTPEAELISRADAESLMAGIDSLPPEFREVLVLRDIQGLNYQEIAQVTSVPLGTVMSRLARARRRLINKIRSPSEASKLGPASASRNEKEQARAETGSARRR